MDNDFRVARSRSFCDRFTQADLSVRIRTVEAGCLRVSRPYLLDQHNSDLAVNLQVKETAADSHPDLNPTNSCIAKGNHWVHFRGTPRWKVAGHHGDCK